MSRMDQDAVDFARMLRYVADCVSYYQRVSSYNDCNNCGRKECEYKPEWGEQVRIHCPLWEGQVIQND